MKMSLRLLQLFSQFNVKSDTGRTGRVVKCSKTRVLLVLDGDVVR